MRYPSYSVNAIGFVRSSLGDVGEAPNQASQGAPEALLEIDPTFAPALHLVTPGRDLILLTWLHLADRLANPSPGRPRHTADRRVRDALAGPAQPDRPAPRDRHGGRGTGAVACLRAGGDRRHADPRPQGRDDPARGASSDSWRVRRRLHLARKDRRGQFLTLASHPGFRPSGRRQISRGQGVARPGSVSVPRSAL